MEASTTLTTFMLSTAASINSVQLLGSWDNFSKCYPMERDSRRGGCYWRGCHMFESIICDGQSNDKVAKRDGRLKMGGANTGTM